jgi:hypothetical protein
MLTCCRCSEEPHHRPWRAESAPGRGIGDESSEVELEGALVQHITRFLLELGAGFAFVGRQVLGAGGVFRQRRARQFALLTVSP